MGPFVDRAIGSHWDSLEAPLVIFGAFNDAF